MKSVVGIFPSPDAANRALEGLKSVNVKSNQINFLTPGSSEKEIAAVPTVDMEGTGVGKAFGGLVGGAVAAAGGIHLGMAAAGLMVPGIGPVVAVGAAAAALLGAGGAVGGAAIGEFLESSLEGGLPQDELFVYEDALRKGRTILILRARDQDQADASRQIMAQAGAEDLDSAHEKWWLSIRDTEKKRYTPDWGDFRTDENYYRLGFEAAQRTALHGKTYSAALPLLQNSYPPAACSHGAFRRGYERGRVYHESLGEQDPTRRQ